MSIHNMRFTVKIRKMYTPVHPRFTILKWVVRGFTSRTCYPDGKKRLNQRSIGLQWLIVYSSFSWLASSSLPEVFRTWKTVATESLHFLKFWWGRGRSTLN